MLNGIKTLFKLNAIFPYLNIADYIWFSSPPTAFSSLIDSAGSVLSKGTKEMEDIVLFIVFFFKSKLLYNLSLCP